MISISVSRLSLSTTNWHGHHKPCQTLSTIWWWFSNRFKFIDKLANCFNFNKNIISIAPAQFISCSIFHFNFVNNDSHEKEIHPKIYPIFIEKASKSTSFISTVPSIFAAFRLLVLPMDFILTEKSDSELSSLNLEWKLRRNIFIVHAISMTHFNRLLQTYTVFSQNMKAEGKNSETENVGESFAVFV